MMGTIPIRSASKAIFQFGYMFLLLVQQRCQNIGRKIEISSISLLPESRDGLFYKTTEWCIKYGAIKTTEKLPNNA